MPHNNVYYEFGPYQLNVNTRLLKRSGEKISLTPKAADILVLLVTRAGQLVEKDELLKEIWPNTFVEEANLSQNIFYLRKALGDDRVGPTYIETVTRRGYRFIANVRVFEAEENHLSNGVHDNNRQIVAVLPFLNSTGDLDWEYLADGLTDNLINNLSRVSKLRVMSHRAVVRFKAKEVEPQQVGSELGSTVVLMGKLSLRNSRIAIGVELVDASTGWQLWGESFDSESQDILEIQDAITRQVLAALKLQLTGEEEKRVTARYTENAEAYQSYLEGRYHWSKYTRTGIDKAIGHFRHAIGLDPNYALAYSAIVDCYLRLATNYLPPEDDLPQPLPPQSDPDARIKLRFEWDWKTAQRELKRANDLRRDYPAAHQWHAAYMVSRRFYEEAYALSRKNTLRKQRFSIESLPDRIACIDLTLSEQVQVYCAIAREQVDTGNYDAACQILSTWWKFGEWPTLDGLDQKSCADLLFTAGELAGCVASTRQLRMGQKHGEELLNGSIALFEQLGFRNHAAEGRIELALCYYRQGLFDLGRVLLVRVLNQIDSADLRSLALIRLGSLERHAGRLKDALARLGEASSIVALSGPWVTGRCNLEFASAYKDLALADEISTYFDNANVFYLRALYEFEAVGNHRLAAIVENNLGLLMLIVRKFSDAELHLLRARRAFASFVDRIRCAQVDDSLAQLYLAKGDIESARVTIEAAVLTMENGDEDALLAEALRTKGTVYCRLKRYSEAKRVLEEAHHLAARCGDIEGAGRALIVLLEEIGKMLDEEDRQSVAARLRTLITNSQQLSINRRALKCLEIIDN
jgi:TolB-like protein